jgi:hypothetical protein
VRKFRPKRQPGFTPWWEIHPQKHWTEEEWREWEEEGRPRMPRDMALERRPSKPRLPVPPANQILPSGFSLRPENSQ